MSTIEKLGMGLVGVALVTAFALHAKGLSQLAGSAGQASAQVLNVAEKG